MTDTILSRPRRPSKAARPHAFSLALAIDHIVYQVTPIRGIQDPDVLRAFRLEKKSDRDAVYDVAMTVRGLECSCPDWIARHADHNTAGCKHLCACVELGLLERPPAPATLPPDRRVRDEFDEPAPAPATVKEVVPEPAAAAPEPAPCCEPEPEPRVTVAVEFGDPADPAESDPAEWPAWTDADAWVPSDGIPADDGGPGEDGARLDLEAWIRTQADRYWALGHAAGDLVARVLSTLADEVEMTNARDVPTYEARHLVLTLPAL